LYGPSLRLIFFFITPTTLSQARELLEFDISMYPGATVSRHFDRFNGLALLCCVVKAQDGTLT
jgi:hypothetical protein